MQGVRFIFYYFNAYEKTTVYLVIITGKIYEAFMQDQ